MEQSCWIRCHATVRRTNPIRGTGTVYITTIAMAPLRTLLRRPGYEDGFTAWGSPLETTTTTAMSISWLRTLVEIFFITTTATAPSPMLRPRQEWAAADGARARASLTTTAMGGWI